ncbi:MULTISPECIES: hypothetical protein [unclassified Microcoleus]|nr:MULTISPECIES: hypothetical protein [unclassified Microcoleus]
MSVVSIITQKKIERARAFRLRELLRNSVYCRLDRKFRAIDI